MPDPAAVRSMFARIAPRYDLLNHLLSLGIDRRWRRLGVEAAGALDGARVIDVCCGTGDLALAFAERGARVLGADFTPAMLARARAKRPARGAAGWVVGDALRLPVASGSADVASCGFGIRNVADRRAALAELRRVLRPGGRLVVLEFSTPPGRLSGALYGAYLTRLLPLVGGWISGDRAAYRYLPDTVRAWPGPDELARELGVAGFEGCGYRRLSGGIACLHLGRAAAGGLERAAARGAAEPARR